jgi:hypothetical protein
MGIIDKARQAAEQATDEARRRADSAAAVLHDPDATQRRLDAAGQQAKRGLGVVRKGVSTAIDRIDPNVLADIVIKATALQEKANRSLHQKHSPYRISEISIAASIPPQVNFTISRVDASHEALDGTERESSELIDSGVADTDGPILALDGSEVELEAQIPD